ncbi:MAG: CotH kinase family protein [Erysipelotrichaceae bacterium]
MTRDQKIDRICLLVLALCLLVVYLFHNNQDLIAEQGLTLEYPTRLFDETYVHTIDIQMDDYQAMIREGKEEYHSSRLVIDGEILDGVGIRIKGNNSLRLSQKYNSERLSLKIEVDHYQNQSYYGLDKFTLDASFQDNSYLKTWLAFDMMRFMGVATPLCSYVWVSVNGEPLGLYVAIEEMEESFALRNFGRNHGQLYQPEYTSLQAENADLALQYLGDELELYPNIFDNAIFHPSVSEQERVVAALKILAQGEDLQRVIDVDKVLRYFVVQVFVMNLDSYLGHTTHNYYLYENAGVLQLLPWDYNLAFGTYLLGIANPVKDATLMVNFPIDTPSSDELLAKRPMFSQLLSDEVYYATYHDYFDTLLTTYFASGLFETRIQAVQQMIAPYVMKDPSAYVNFSQHQQAVATIKEFALLRAKSIRLQLDGTLGRSWTARKQTSTPLVDASHIKIEDMGSVQDLKR